MPPRCWQVRTDNQFAEVLLHIYVSGFMELFSFSLCNQSNDCFQLNMTLHAGGSSNNDTLLTHSIYLHVSAFHRSTSNVMLQIQMFLIFFCWHNVICHHTSLLSVASCCKFYNCLLSNGLTSFPTKRYTHVKALLCVHTMNCKCCCHHCKNFAMLFYNAY